MVLTLCDELDKAKDLNDYYNKTLQDHIKKTVVPKISLQGGAALLKEFVRLWNNYTILVHFMRKMFNYLVRKLMELNQNKGSVLPEELQHAEPGNECSGLLPRLVLQRCLG